jgi:hypothetical protein
MEWKLWRNNQGIEMLEMKPLINQINTTVYSIISRPNQTEEYQS